MTLRLLDLFSGIGGFSYAAEQLVGGFTTVQFVEIDTYCQQVLRQHWPDVPIHDDISTYQPLAGAADVICGGFPCQDISYAGLGAGIADGTRSGLFYQLMRVARAVRPSFIVLENVAAIRTRGLDIVLGELAAAGFDAEWACIRASDVGACHKRDRWWLVAYAQSELSDDLRPTYPGQAPKSKSGDRYRSDAPDTDHPRSQRYGAERQLREGGSQVEIRWCSSHRLSSDWRSYLSQPVICRGDDGFSDRAHRLKALGNAVVPQVAAVPLRRVLELAA